VLSDGALGMPAALAAHASDRTQAAIVTMEQAVGALGLSVGASEWPLLELAVCAQASGAARPAPSGRGVLLSASFARQASTLLLSAYSPVSALVRHRAELLAAASALLTPPAVLEWKRVDSHTCIPLFSRTARFEIQSNAFGILGQYGPERKLQLASTDVRHIIGSNHKVLPNASLEMEVYVSNASHVLRLVEYMKENNAKGVHLQVAPERRTRPLLCSARLC
jgi:hypothetical protein